VSQWLPGNFVAAGSRRSTRIEKSVPLIVLGQNRTGEPFVERTVSVSVNMHGCRYHSRHDYGVGTWVTLQAVGLISSEEKPATVRAIVRSVHPPGSLRELQQVGVELETPANVWGIERPPADWLSAREANASTAQHAAVVAPAQESATKKVGLGEMMKPEPKMAEVASFPSPSPAPAFRPPAPKVPEAPQPPRVVVTPDRLISALQGKLQQEAEKAVQAAVAKQVNDVVREAISSIDDARLSSLREVQELFPTQIEAMKLSLKEESGEMAAQWKADMEMHRGQAEEITQRLEKQARELRRELANAQEYVERMTREIAPQIPARLREAVTQATSDFESATAVVMGGHYERLLENVQILTQESLLKLNARSAEVQALVQSAANSGLEEFRREAELHLNMALAETKERAVSALSSLDADSRATCDARRQALETEVARSAERETEQFRKGMKAFLYSCLVAAVGAVDEYSKATLDGLLKDDAKTLDEARSKSPAQDEDKIIPDADSSPMTH
jgi:hypothetical protein